MRQRNSVRILCLVLLLVLSVAESFVQTETAKRSKTMFHTLNKNNNNIKLSAAKVPSSSTSVCEKEEGYRIGFIGCGTIASAIAHGLATQSSIPIQSIAVSRRSVDRSTKLSETFPELVSIHDDNQRILEEADIVFLCVLPQDADHIVQSMKFDAQRHTLVSLVSTSQLTKLQQLSGLPISRVTKMICLPAVAQHQGTCLFIGNNNIDTTFLRNLFRTLGGSVECKDEDTMRKLQVATNLMGPFYGILRANRNWLVDQGIPPQDATYFLTRTYFSMIQDVNTKINSNDNNLEAEEEAICRIIDDLIEEQTPGGFNEQALNNLEYLGITNIYKEIMDKSLERLEGESDGWATLSLARQTPKQTQ